MSGWKVISGYLSPHRPVDEVRYETPEPTFSPSPPSAYLSQDLICEDEEIMPPQSHQPLRTQEVPDSDYESMSDVSRDLVRETKYQNDSDVDTKTTRRSSRVMTGAPSSISATSGSQHTRVPPHTDEVTHKPPSPFRTPLSRGRRSSARRNERTQSLSQRSRTVSTGSDTRKEATYDTPLLQAEVYPSRSLRKRTVQQTNPYKFDKYQHTISRKSGHSADSEDVEEAVYEEIEMTQTRLSSKNKSKASTAANKRKLNATPSKKNGKRRRFSSNASVTAEDNQVNSFDPARVTLKVWLDGFPAAGAPTTLFACGDVEGLFDFIVKSWGWSFEGARIRYAIISFPWLSEESNILLRPGLRESFTKMVSEVEKAECWKSGGDEASCEIKITVYLQSKD
ncbi:uncharacterized protein PV06_02987 [Exophiala oligosperma]|uniref:Uncharacterized protein n=1 Tax=Exophiala oligosperma TaxID=215243 RepID=A0A0D2AXL4_9EURO|nr:uncharacterized protein PV06_02987 [Exophiala oligosperma]KIW44526.1 hypothetical protein PV06_02987 [Exophiala oligosperma]